jgi:tetratricopeptide (TPR) repeat protein
MDKVDKIAGLREILELDPKNSFARYGMAMELANRGETAAAVGEFDTLLANDPGYTAGYFMAAQTLAKAARTAEAIERREFRALFAAGTAMRSVRCRRCSTSWRGRSCSLPRTWRIPIWHDLAFIPSRSPAFFLDSASILTIWPSIPLSFRSTMKRRT